mmetsp:Transcript_20059/g.55841  ORF Transcript_20059/g.55841 Transcript_20059/m.55841 type:complete len:226 (-) Transcript_20059:3686-4363(-)
MQSRHDIAEVLCICSQLRASLLRDVRHLCNGFGVHICSSSYSDVEPLGCEALHIHLLFLLSCAGVSAVFTCASIACSLRFGAALANVGLGRCRSCGQGIHEVVGQEHQILANHGDVGQRSGTEAGHRSNTAWLLLLCPLRHGWHHLHGLLHMRKQHLKSTRMHRISKFNHLCGCLRQQLASCVCHAGSQLQDLLQLLRLSCHAQARSIGQHLCFRPRCSSLKGGG